MLPVDPQLLELLRTASHIVVLTGAGVSAESGVPTFRDAMTGLWSKFDSAELATPEAFARDPELVSRWYDERRCDVAACSPNAGHLALARLQRQCSSRGQRFTLVTQNVDRLHQAAGSTGVIELHGTLWIWRSTDCGEETEERGPAFAVYPPRCSCGGRKRPAVVWFGESLPRHALLQAERASGSATVFMSMGTSSVVYPAAGLIDLALRNNANLMELNPQETAYSRRARWSIRGNAARSYRGSLRPHSQRRIKRRPHSFEKRAFCTLAYRGTISIALICGFSTCGENVIVIRPLVTVMGTVSTYAFAAAPAAFQGLKSFTCFTVLPLAASPSFTSYVKTRIVGSVMPS
jgi:NAD-dependent deacetylase